MAEYKGWIDYDKTVLKSGDVIIDGNPSVMDGRTIAVDGLTFERCNMFGVTIRPSWTLKNCYHVNKTKADLPVPPTQAELDAAKVEQLTAELEVIAITQPLLVEAAIKTKPTLVTVSSEVAKVVPIEEEPIIKEPIIKG